MFAIIINEIKKPFYHKFFRWFLILLLLAHVILCASLLNIQEPYTVLKPEQITQEYYCERLSKICADAEQNMNRLLKFDVVEKDYAYRYQQEIIFRYTSLQKTVHIVSESPADGWTVYFQYNYFQIFSGLCALILVSAIMVHDRNSGMWDITRTAKYGRGRVFIGKICAVFILSFLFTLLCQLIVLGFAWNVKGLSNPFVDLQNLPDFFLSSYHGTIFSFCIFTLLQRSIIVAVFALVTAAVAAWSGRYFAAIMSGTMLYGLGYTFHVLPLNSAWRYLNFYEALLPTSFYGRYEAVNFAANPIPILVMCGIATLFVLSISVILVCIGLSTPLKRISKRFSIARLSEKLTSAKTKRYEKLSLSRQELYKTLSPAVLLALFICIGFHIYADAGRFLHQESYQEYTLKEYADVLEGLDYNAQNHYITEEFNRLGDILSSETEMTNLFFNGNISADEFQEYNRSFQEASARITPLIMVQERMEYLQKIYVEKNVRGRLLFDSALETLLNGAFPIGMYICIVLVSCVIASVDYRKSETGICFSEIISTTKHGRKRTLYLKLLIVCISATMFSLLFSGIDLLFYRFASEKVYFDVPLLSFPSFASTDSGITIHTWLLIEQLMNIGFACLLGLFCFCVTFYIRNSLYSYIIILIVTLLPRLLFHMGLDFMQYLDSVMLLSSTPFYQLSSEFATFDYGLVLIYVTVLSAGAFLLIRKCALHCERNL